MRTAVLMAAAGIVFGVILGRATAPTPAAAEAPIGNGDLTPRRNTGRCASFPYVPRGRARRKVGVQL